MARKTAPKPPLVLLVRHGQTSTTGSVLPGRAAGLHLADKGRAQADAVAARIAGVKGVTSVYSSPLERTRETAAPIARSVGVRARISRGLLECDFGSWTGRKLADLMKLPEWRAVQTTPSMFRFPDGESFVEMQHRIVGELEELVARHPGERIVCVSHADPIKAAVAHFAGTHLDLFQRTVISPCSVTPLLLGVGPPVVLAVNSCGDDLSSLAPS
jgi:probable phosphomutase (TIGR03848 family)